jgi:hypothetical protein
MSQAEQEPGVALRFGRAINLPTILTCLSMVCGAAVFVVRTVGEIDKKADDAMRESRINSADIKRVEQNQITAQRDVRDDLKEISRKLDTLADRLYDRTGGKASSIKEWTR